MLHAKLRWVKKLRKHLCLPPGREVWVWFDICSIPQRSRDLQMRAIESLPSYTQLCTRLVDETDVCEKCGRLPLR